MLDTADRNTKWKKITDIPGASRGGLGAASVTGRIYVLGGTHFFDPKPDTGNDRKRLDEIWQYDPNKNRFFADFSGGFQHGLSFSFPQKNRMRVR